MTVLAAPATIIGGPVSPYVRKVLAVCETKGIPYRLDPIVPFFGDDGFGAVSPLRRIPVYSDDRVTGLCDSTVICEYLEDRFPSPRMMPADPATRARARWLEEFADTRIADIFIWRIFYQAVVKPFVFKTERDKARIARAVAEDVPEVMAYLESVAPDEGFAGGSDVSIADIAVAVSFGNLRWARVELDEARWPKTLAWVNRTTAVPGLAKITSIAQELARTPIPQHRAALAGMGMTLTDTTVAAAVPRPGMMAID